MRSDALATLSRRGLAVMSALLISVGLRAQSASAAPRAPAVNVETSLFFDRVSMSASLEYVLLGIPGLTDAQRDQLEALEATTRESIARAAAPLRDARRNNLRGWPSEPDMHEAPLNRIAVIRNTSLDRAREILDVSQRERFDRNQLASENFPFVAWLRTDDLLWMRYLQPYLGSSTIGH